MDLVVGCVVGLWLLLPCMICLELVAGICRCCYFAVILVLITGWVVACCMFDCLLICCVVFDLCFVVGR